MSMSERIRVLVVDDSALMRKLIPAILARDSSIEVVGTAMDGAFALKKIEELQPDVVTLDLEMPRMDGMEMLRLIMKRAPLPIILFSTHSKEGGYATLKALALGAVDFLQKPKDAATGHLEEIADQLIAKIKVAKRAGKRKLPPVTVVEELSRVTKGARPTLPPRRVIAVGISTGGPNALQYMLSQIPGDFLSTIVVVQHMPQHAEHRDRDRLAEVKRLAGAGDDGRGIVHVCVNVVGGTLGRTGQQGPRVRQYQGVVVHVDDLGFRRHALGDLVGIVGGRQAGSDIKELADPGLPGQVPYHPPEEQAVLARLPHDVGQHLLDAVAHLAVDLVVVFALQPVIPDSGRVGHGRVDPGAGGGVRFRGRRNVSHRNPSGSSSGWEIRCPGLAR